VDIVLALVAAFLFALGLVLQQRAASSQPAESVVPPAPPSRAPAPAETA
jgi:hypothetical protein